MTASARAKERLILQSAEPLNAETPPATLAASFLTAQRDFYVRSHGTIPLLTDDHRLTIDGLVDRPRSFDLAELRAAFPTRTIVATMQCAGNRRAHLQEVAKTAGDPWGVGAIGNAEWSGVSLADVLAARGVQDGAAFVGMTCADMADVDGESEAYGASIPLAKALDGDVLIAWAMNGEPLQPEHGAPLRLIVPGYAGVRSPKWLTRIEVRDRPSDASIQARDYKLFPAAVTKAQADWDRGLTINEMPVNSAICEPAAGAAIAAGPVTVRGYAVAFGRSVARVDLSPDGGATWIEASMAAHPEAPWSWTLWEAQVALATGTHELIVRAIDDAGQMQPERPAGIWNFAGYLSTAWHRVDITVA